MSKKQSDTQLGGAVSCPLCSGKGDKTLAAELRRGSGQVHYCAQCDHGFLVAAPLVDPKLYYAESYRKEYSHNADAAATNARELFEVYSNYQRDRLRMVTPLLGPQTRLLEVGASSGQFLVHVKDQVAEVNAIELDKACCAYVKSELGIAADDELLEHSVFASKTYDVVCAFQVMEHVGDPVAFLEGLRAATKEGGHIFVEVPNIADPLLSIWDVPTYHKFYYHSAHLHYFSEASLRLVAERAGFSADEIEVLPTQDYNLLNHLHWIMNDGPQANCHIGLSEITLAGVDTEIAQWLTQEMRALNEKYVSKLIEKNKTSNLMLRLRNGN
jgi:2-polyprenyl-3-methyl-5-hydroxy-6-metoxy-1,4-benzoquinol methylase